MTRAPPHLFSTHTVATPGRRVDRLLLRADMDMEGIPAQLGVDTAMPVLLGPGFVVGHQIKSMQSIPRFTVEVVETQANCSAEATTPTLSFRRSSHRTMRRWKALLLR